MHRLFFALTLKEQKYLENLLNETKCLFSEKNKIKWVKTDHLHITLFFIGEVDNSITNEIIKHCEKLFHNINSFSIEYSKNLIFYHRSKPSIIGIEFKPNEHILKLKDKIENLMERFDIIAEKRKFIPHITFGRVKEYSNLLEFNKYEKYSFSEKDILNIASFKLFNSTLTINGPIYEPLWQIKF